MYNENNQPLLSADRPATTPARRPYAEPLTDMQHNERSLPATPAFGGLAQTPSPELLIQPLFINKMANEMGLTNDLHVNLHTFVQLGTRDVSLSKGDLLTRLFTLAAIFQNTAERRRHEAGNSITSIAELMNDLKIRLEDTFHLSKEQNDNVCVVTQDLMYQSSRVAFKTIHLDVIKEISKHKKDTGFTNIFGNPARERVLLIRAKRIASSVRNTFRQDLQASVFGDAKTSLEEFTLDTAGKYKRLTIGEAVTQADLVHNLLLRSFAIDHPGLLNVDENEGSDDDSVEGTGAPKKKRKHGGRVPKDEDFWLQLDKYFAKQVEANRCNLTGPKWKTVVDLAILREKERLGAAPQDSLQLPSASASSQQPIQWGQQSAGQEASHSQPRFEERGELSQGYQWGQTNGAQAGQYANPYNVPPMSFQNLMT